MPSASIILGFSSLLFLYWFRYTCLLILRAKTTKDHTAKVAEANGLDLPHVQARLRLSPDAAELEELKSALEHDYRLLTAILSYTSQFYLTGFRLEERMLMINFHGLALWFAAIRYLPQLRHQAHAAVEEMAEVVSHFANSLGERSRTATALER